MLAELQVRAGIVAQGPAVYDWIGTTTTSSQSTTGETERPPQIDRRSPAAEPERPQKSAVRDPGERRAIPTQVPEARADSRVLRYEPPGSRVGDPGERPPVSEVSVSLKPIRELIQRWANTLLSGDLGSHMSLFAQRLDRFNGSPNVARETVSATKRRVLSGFSGVQRFEVNDLGLQPLSDGSVRAEFRIASNAPIAGRYRLGLRLASGQWRIYAEEKVQRSSSE
ncbi:MAG: hypothetical protein WKF37_14335 [Bryobacteraceae bacterium]